MASWSVKDNISSAQATMEDNDLVVVVSSEECPSSYWQEESSGADEPEPEREAACPSSSWAEAMEANKPRVKTIWADVQDNPQEDLGLNGSPWVLLICQLSTLSIVGFAGFTNDKGPHHHPSRVFCLVSGQ